MKKMKAKKKWLLALAGVFCMGILLFGCGKENAEEKEPVKEEPAKEEAVTEEEPEETYQVIGRESEDAYDILLTNKTGKVIKGIQVKSSEQKEYPANMMAGSQKIEKDETVELYYTSEAAEKSESKEADSDEEDESEDTKKDTPEIADAVMNVVYSLQITFEDGTSQELTSFAVDDIEEAEICYEEEVAFLTYESKSEDVEISTKEAELALKADKKAAKTVTDQIQNVGGVTLESEAGIQAARAAYNALTDTQKKLVTNESLLAEQEAVLAALKEQAAAQAAAEQAAAQAAAEQAAAQRAAQQNNYNNSGSYSGGGSSSGYSDSASQGTGGCLDDVILN